MCPREASDSLSWLNTQTHTQSYTLIVVLSRQANKETNESQAHTVCTRENPQGNADSQTIQTARVTSRSHCLKLNIWVWTFFCNKLHHNVSLWMCCNWLTDTFFQFSAVCVSWSSLLCSYCVIALDGREQSPAVCCGLVFLVYKTRFTDDLCMRTIRLTYFLQSSHHWLHLFQHFLLFLTLWGWSHPQQNNQKSMFLEWIVSCQLDCFLIPLLPKRLRTSIHPSLHLLPLIQFIVPGGGKTCKLHTETWKTWI